LRDTMQFVGQRLQDHAARRSHGSDSGTSEDERESRLDSDSGY
jgi:hypothetical protein